MMMPSSKSQEDLRPAEDSPYFRKRKTSKNILDALGVSCQVASSTAGDAALLNPLAADGPEVDSAAADGDDNETSNETPRESTAIANDMEVRVAVD